MHLFARGDITCHMSFDVPEKAVKLSGPVSGVALGGYLAVPELQCGEERGGAVSAMLWRLRLRLA
jgi:hypothetical protein